MSVGGRVIEIAAVELDDGTPAHRYWCMDRDDTEVAVYGEVVSDAPKPKLGDNIWWQSGRIYFDNDKHTIRKLGYSFDPRRPA